jgi:hypothetical protein
MVLKFGGTATILHIPSLIRPDPAMKLLHTVAAALVGLSSCQATPVHAGVGTAAWVTAGSICQALSNGLTIRQAVRVGMSDNLYLWAAEMQDPLFSRLVAAESAKRCPELLMRNAPGSMQL